VITPIEVKGERAGARKHTVLVSTGTCTEEDRVAKKKRAKMKDATKVEAILRS